MKETEIKKLCKDILEDLGYSIWSPRPTYIPKAGYRPQDMFHCFDIEAVKCASENLQIQITSYDNAHHRISKIMAVDPKHSLVHNHLEVWALRWDGKGKEKKHYFVRYRMFPYTRTFEKHEKITIERKQPIKYRVEAY